MNKDKKLMNVVKTLILPVALYVLFAILAPHNFVSWTGLKVILVSASVYTLIGWGVCFNLVVGTWDFSAGAAIALAGCVAADVANKYGFIGMIVAAVAVTWGCEILTGLVYKLLKIPTLITTIGMLLVYEMFTGLYNSGMPITVPSSMQKLGAFPYIFILLILGGIIFEILYNHTVFGHNVKSVGHGAQVAKTVGINPVNVKFLCFVAGGAIISIASIAYLCYGGTSAAKSNFSTMDAIFSPMMGVTVGLALEKYCKLLYGVFIGEVSIKIIAQGLIAMGASSSAQKIVTGIALLCVFTFSAISLIRTEKAEKKERMQQVQ